MDSPVHARPSIPVLLDHDEPPACSVVNPEGAASVLLVADHASNRIPRCLGGLGLAAEELDRHIGWDIGTDVVARELSRLFDATLVIANYSRLVIDLNRALSDPTVIAPISDGIEIPGNQRLEAEDREARVHELFVPYRRAIDTELARLRRRGIAPGLVAIHSFTPLMDGQRRPWHVGVLWDKDPRIPLPLMQNLADHPAGLTVGDNQPYSGKHPADYTVDHHGEANGLPHVSIELRQDLIAEPAGARNWARILHDCLAPILLDPALYTLWQR